MAEQRSDHQLGRRRALAAVAALGLALAVLLAAGLAVVAAAAFTIGVGLVPGWLIDAADTVTIYAR